jgi:hypothetical protein
MAADGIGWIRMWRLRERYVNPDMSPDVDMVSPVIKATTEQPFSTRFVPALCIGVLLLFTFRQYTFAYFWLDDFNNLHWIQQWSLLDGIGHVFSPSAQYFRPVGMLVYQIAFNLFDRDPRPYHWLMWAIHSLNVAIVYVVLKRFTESRAGAAVGAMLFAYPPIFTDIFWSFGTIFELIGAALFFTGMLLWQRKSRSLAIVLASCAVFILAIKTKEMAITLPAVWLLQDVLLRRPLKWKEFGAIVLPGLIGAWYGLQKLSEMRAPDPNQPYYMDFHGIVMGRGFGFYFNTLFDTNLRWQIWCIGFTVVLLILLALKWRLAAFFQMYVFVTFLPLIFLVNHRGPFYWYFPMLGVCGLAALLVKTATERVTSRISPRRLAPYGSFAFALLCLVYFIHSSRATAVQREQQQDISEKYRGFVESLQQLPPPDQGETLFFTSVPDYFDADALRFASELALHRSDIAVKLVQESPPDARYRLVFENSRVSIRH